MKIRALNVLVLLVLGFSSLAHAGTPPTTAANQTNVVGLPATSTGPLPPSGASAARPSAGLQNANAGIVAMWRGCYFLDPLSLASNSSSPSPTTDGQHPGARYSGFQKD